MGYFEDLKAINKAIAKKEFYCQSCTRYHANASKVVIGRRKICKYCHEKINSRSLAIKSGPTRTNQD